MKFLFSFILAMISSTSFAQTPPIVERVIVVVLENKDYAEAMRQPFLVELANRGALIDNHYALARPSQPNYIGLIAGDLHGVSGNSNYDLNERNIVDLLEANGKSWKAYNEGYPGNCYTGAKRGEYVRKHNPFISFTNISENPARCAKIVNGAQFQTDYKNGTLPHFSFYTPDMRNDGHDTSVEFAAKAMQATFGKFLQDEAAMRGTLFIMTFDEAQIFSNSKVYTSFVGPMVKTGSRTTAKTNHYSVLRTIEEVLGLDNLGLNDKTAEPIAGIWN